MIKYEKTAVKEWAILDLIYRFIDKHEISCSESAYQNDDVMINSPELIGDIVDILGVEYIDE